MQLGWYLQTERHSPAPSFSFNPTKDVSLRVPNLIYSELKCLKKEIFFFCIEGKIKTRLSLCIFFLSFWDLFPRNQVEFEKIKVKISIWRRTCTRWRSLTTRVIRSTWRVEDSLMEHSKESGAYSSSFFLSLFLSFSPLSPSFHTLFMFRRFSLLFCSLDGITFPEETFTSITIFI